MWINIQNLALAVVVSVKEAMDKCASNVVVEATLFVGVDDSVIVVVAVETKTSDSNTNSNSKCSSCSFNSKYGGRVVIHSWYYSRVNVLVLVTLL